MNNETGESWTLWKSETVYKRFDSAANCPSLWHGIWGPSAWREWNIIDCSTLHHRSSYTISESYKSSQYHKLKTSSHFGVLCRISLLATSRSQLPGGSLLIAVWKTAFEAGVLMKMSVHILSCSDHLCFVTQWYNMAVLSNLCNVLDVNTCLIC